jgi:hypothetical protein
VFEQSLRAQWSVFQWRRGPLPEALTSETCYRAMIVRCATLHSPSRADLILCRAIGPLGVPSRGTPKWKSPIGSFSSNSFQAPAVVAVGACNRPPTPMSTGGTSNGTTTLTIVNNTGYTLQVSLAGAVSRRVRLSNGGNQTLELGSWARRSSDGVWHATKEELIPCGP